MSKKSNLIIGSAIVEELYKIKKIPEKGGHVLAHEHDVYVGGCAFNVAANMKMLKENVDLLAPIGTGKNAEIIKEVLDKLKLKTMFVSQEDDSGKCVTLIDETGERSFISFPTLKNLDKKWLDKVDWKSYDNISIDGYRIRNIEEKYIIDQLKKATSAKIFFAVGGGVDFIPKINLDAILKLSPIIHLNETELYKLTKIQNIDNALKFLSSINRNDIFLTLGSKGMIYYDFENSASILFESTHVNQIINTNGAGDVHLAAIITFLNKGMTIKDICLNANKLASLIVQSKTTVLTDDQVQSVVWKLQK